MESKFQEWALGICMFNEGPKCFLLLDRFWKLGSKPVYALKALRLSGS